MFKHKKRDSILTNRNIKRYIKNDVLIIPKEITEIADNAAYENCSIKKVFIPNGVVKIGKKAFCGSSIEEVVFESRVFDLIIDEYAFARTDIKSISLHFEAILGEGCFCDCLSLKEVSLGVDITEIPKCCFLCSALSQIVLPEKIKKIGSRAFEKTNLSEITIPANIDIIEEKAFRMVSSLKVVKAFNLQNITDSVFESCTSLEKVTISYQNDCSNYGLELGDNVFRHCENLKSFELEGGGYISSVGSSTFYHCQALRKIDLSSTKTIGENAFSGAKSLREIGELKKVEEIGSSAFYECYFLNNLVFGTKLLNIENHAFAKCKRLQKVELPIFLQKLGVGVFAGCTSLETVKISSRDLECLSVNTFQKCISLKAVIIDTESEICGIGANCFSYCTALSEITLPKKIQVIGNEAFLNCSSLVKLSFEATGLIIEDFAFACCERLRNFEVKGSIECIKAAFCDCHSLTTITIPFPNKFGENFVSRCRNLQKIEFQQTDIF